MRDHDDVPYIVIERRSGGVGPFLWGVLMGAAAALLLAPRSGRETKEEIRRGVQRVRTAAEDRIEAARDTVTRTKERFGGRFEAVKGRIDDVRDRIEPRAERAREVVDEGRRVARNMREEVERRLSHTRARSTETGSETTAGATMGDDMPASREAAASGFDTPLEIEEPLEGPTDLT